MPPEKNLDLLILEARAEKASRRYDRAAQLFADASRLAEVEGNDRK